MLVNLELILVVCDQGVKKALWRDDSTILFGDARGDLHVYDTRMGALSQCVVMYAPAFHSFSTK